ncbi:hypothetical protein HDU67_004844, partial [Dinochytrium kinnereticum]
KELIWSQYPFPGYDVISTERAIMDNSNYLWFPSDTPPLLKDLIENLLYRCACDVLKLGLWGARYVKTHNFFFSYDWEQIIECKVGFPRDENAEEDDGCGNISKDDTMAKGNLCRLEAVDPTQILPMMEHVRYFYFDSTKKIKHVHWKDDDE